MVSFPVQKVLLLLCFVSRVISTDTTAAAPEESSPSSEAATEAPGETPAATGEATEAPAPAPSEIPGNINTAPSEAPAPPAPTSNIYGLDDKCASPSVVIPPFMRCVEVGCVEREPCQTPQLRDSHCCPHTVGFDTVTCCLFAGGSFTNQGQGNGGTYQNGYEPFPRPYPGNYQPPYGYPGGNPVYSWG